MVYNLVNSEKHAMDDGKGSQWEVLLTSSAEKQLNRIPTTVCDSFILLIKEIEASGPIRGNWRNFSRLDKAGKVVYHCHIKSGVQLMWCVGG